MADLLRFNRNDYYADDFLTAELDDILDTKSPALVKALDGLSSLSPIEVAFMDRYCQILHEFPLAQRHRILYFMSIM